MVRLPGFASKPTNRQVIETAAINQIGSKTMRTKSIGIKGLALALALIATGCATSPDTVVVEPEAEETPEVVVPEPKEEAPLTEELPAKDPVPSQADSAQNDKQPAAGEMVTVSVYTIDDQCNDFVSEPIQVSSAKAIDEAVGMAMTSVDYNAFKLAGYQVNVSGGTAVVDMQLAPGSERKFVSLSSCEQRSLFGSIEETLKNNEDWGVRNVKFTNAGKDIIL